MATVEEVRDRILQLAREIEELSQTNVPKDKFFDEFLRRVIGAVGARAGAIWMKSPSGRLERYCEQGFEAIGFDTDAQAEPRNQKLLAEVINTGQARTYSPDDPNSPELPTNDLLVLAAFQESREIIGAIEIFQRSDTPPAARPGFLQFVEQMCGFACRYLDRQVALAPSPEIAELADDFEHLVRRMHQSLDVRKISSIIAENGREVANCDRISVAMLRGRRATILASSDSNSVDQSSQTTRLLSDVAAKAILTKEPLVCDGSTDDYPPQIEKPLVAYVGQSDSKMLMIVPFFQTDPMIQHEEEDGPRIRSKEVRRIPIGGIVIEQSDEAQPKDGQLEKVSLIAEHASAAFSNAKAYHGLYFLGIWKALGALYALLEGRTFLKTLAVFAIIIGIIAAFMFVPYEYRVECDGRVMPVEQVDVFAPRDGRVDQILAQSLSTVKEGEDLIYLANDDLEAQILAQTSLRDAKAKQYESLQAQFDAADSVGLSNEATQIQGKYVQTEIEWKHAIKRLEVLEKRKESLIVRAPSDGVISTFELAKTLKDRPVRQGELLLEIKNENGPWRLELSVEEHRIGHLFNAMEELQTDTLPVEFVLNTDTETVYHGELTKISSRANAEAETGSIFIVFASASKDEIENCRIGAEVRAKISCGERSLGYVLIGDVIEFLERRFWIDRWYDGVFN
ncbi:MAG: hypothetical protein CMJ78_12110 [Planctomycetaceae bacterium]|nr:hypothetical protein [Planctomycetaceae bacterium]